MASSPYSSIVKVPGACDEVYEFRDSSAGGRRRDQVDPYSRNLTWLTHGCAIFLSWSHDVLQCWRRRHDESLFGHFGGRGRCSDGSWLGRCRLVTTALSASRGLDVASASGDVSAVLARLASDEVGGCTVVPFTATSAVFDPTAGTGSARSASI